MGFFSKIKKGLEKTKGSIDEKLNNVIFNKNETKLIYYPTNKIGSFSVPNTVKTISSYAFYRSKLDDVNLSNVEAIESNHADRNVENYEYDYIIENDGTLEQLDTMAKLFVRDIELKTGKRFDASFPFVIGIGTRFSDFTTASKSLFKQDAKFITINTDRFDAYKLSAFKAVCDAKLGIENEPSVMEDLLSISSGPTLIISSLTLPPQFLTVRNCPGPQK